MKVIHFLPGIICLCLILIFPTSCKKEIVDPGNQPEEMRLLLDQAEAYHYGVVILEATQQVDNFDGKVYLDGTEVSAGLVENKYIAFTVQPEAGSGGKKLSLDVNGKKFEFALEIRELPAVSDPDATINEYIAFVETLSVNTIAAMKEAYQKTGIDGSVQFDGMESDLKLINDSIEVYKGKFNGLSHEEKLAAARMVQASRLKLQPVYDFMEGYSDFITNSGVFRKNGSICELTNNPSASWACVFKETEKNAKTLLKELAVNAVLGGATGALVGAILGPAGAAAGAKIGAIVFILNNIKSVGVFLGALDANYEAAMLVTKTSWAARKSETIFTNGEPKPMTLEIEKRNLQAGDKNSEFSVIKNYMTAVTGFCTYVSTKLSSYIKSIPAPAAQRSVKSSVADLKFMKVEVLNNPNVKFEALGGTPEAPTITFIAVKGEDQAFEYKLKYDDGVFIREETHNGILQSFLKMTLKDTVAIGGGMQMNFYVYAPQEVEWTLSENADWLTVTPASGNGNKWVQLNVDQRPLMEPGDRTVMLELKSKGTTISSAKITQKPRTYVVLDEQRDLLNTVSFKNGKESTFYLSEDKIAATIGVDYSKVSIAGNTNSNISIALQQNSDNFRLTLTHTKPEKEGTTFDLLYDGKKVETISAEILQAAVGDKFQGGRVAYILKQGDMGYVSGEVHGLVLAPTDQSHDAQWCSSGLSFIGGGINYDTTRRIGEGYHNTLEIIKDCSSPDIAARLCYDLELNGYSDWFLPSVGEFLALWDNRNLLGLSDTYWTSSESHSGAAVTYNFSFGYTTSTKKYDFYAVRAMRSF